jgi:hypothetical protein
MHYVLVQERLAERICMIHFKTVSVNITACEYFPFTLEACLPTSLILSKFATLYSPKSTSNWVFPGASRVAGVWLIPLELKPNVFAVYLGAGQIHDLT